MLTVQPASDAAGRLPSLEHLALGLLGGEGQLPGLMPRGIGLCLAFRMCGYARRIFS